MTDICLSGGAEGADTAWGEAAKAAGHDVRHYVFGGINKKHAYPRFYLNWCELLQAEPHLKKANETLKRGNFPYKSEYVINLLRRNYWQVKNTERVYAVAPLDLNKQQVRGGTGWAVQMAIDLGVPEIYVFDTVKSMWFTYVWKPYDCFAVNPSMPPKPHGRYTGIGSREITEAGLAAIKQVYQQ